MDIRPLKKEETTKKTQKTRIKLERKDQKDTNQEDQGYLDVNRVDVENERIIHDLIIEGEKSYSDHIDTYGLNEIVTIDEVKRRHWEENKGPKNWFNPWDRRVMSAQINIRGSEIETKIFGEKKEYLETEADTQPIRNQNTKQESRRDRREAFTIKNHSRSPKSTFSSSPIVLNNPLFNRPNSLMNSKLKNTENSIADMNGYTGETKEGESIHHMMGWSNQNLNIDMYLKQKMSQGTSKSEKNQIKPKKNIKSQNELRDKQLQKMIKDKVTKANYFLFNKNPYFTGALKRMIIRELDSKKYVNVSGVQGVDIQNKRGTSWENRVKGGYITDKVSGSLFQDNIKKLHSNSRNVGKRIRIPDYSTLFQSNQPNSPDRASNTPTPSNNNNNVQIYLNKLESPAHFSGTIKTLNSISAKEKGKFSAVKVSIRANGGLETKSDRFFLKKPKVSKNVQVSNSMKGQKINNIA